MSTFPRVECVTVAKPVSVDVPLREHTHVSARMCSMLTTDAPVPVPGLCPLLGIIAVASAIMAAAVVVKVVKDAGEVLRSCADVEHACAGLSGVRAWLMLGHRVPVLGRLILGFELQFLHCCPIGVHSTAAKCAA